MRSEFGDFSGGVTQADMQEDTALRCVGGSGAEMGVRGLQSMGPSVTEPGDRSAPWRLGSYVLPATGKPGGMVPPLATSAAVRHAQT